MTLSASFSFNNIGAHSKHDYVVLNGNRKEQAELESKQDESKSNAKNSGRLTHKALL